MTLPGRHPIRAFALATAVTAVVVLVAPACSSGTDQANQSATTATVAPAPTAPPGLSAAPLSGPVLVSPFLLHDGWLATGSAQQVESVDGLNAALDALLAGPTPVDDAAGLSTAIPRNAEVRSLALDGGTARVDFTRPFETADTQPQVAQVVFTLTQVEGVTAVQFLIDGEPNGATGVKPLSRAAFLRYTPPAVVSSPTPGQVVTSPIAVSGTATATGPTITYRLEDPAGSLLAEGSLVVGDGGLDGAPFAGTIDPGGYTGQAVLIMPAPDPGTDDAALTRVPFAIA